MKRKKKRILMKKTCNCCLSKRGLVWNFRICDNLDYAINTLDYAINTLDYAINTFECIYRMHLSQKAGTAFHRLGSKSSNPILL